MELYTIDLGNSHPHIGYFNGDHLEGVFPIKTFEKKPQVLSIHSSVGNTLSYTSLLADSFDIKNLYKNKSFLDLNINYSDSLGMDRIAQAYLAFKMLTPDTKNILVIDIGTYITMDVINKKGFIGGHILPGMNSFFSSYQNGELLKKFPLNDKSIKLNEKIPTDTETAMANSFPLMLTSTAYMMAKKHKINLVILSGGGANPFHQILLNELIEIQNLTITSRPHFIHEALFKIFTEMGKQQ